MREILFRGIWVHGNNEWIEGDLVRDSEGKPHIVDNKYAVYWGGESTFVCEDECEVIPETVGQYTGLTDKNGKKIFEGDIIRYADMYDYNCYLESLENKEAYDKWNFGDIWVIDKVCYFAEEGYPAFDLCKREFDTNGLSELSESMQYYYYEVIGNIHDNPELLEVK